MRVALAVALHGRRCGDGLLRGNTHPSRIAPLAPEVSERVCGADPDHRSGRDDALDGGYDGCGQRDQCQRGTHIWQARGLAYFMLPAVQGGERL